MKNKKIIILLIVLIIITTFRIYSHAITLPWFSISSNNYSNGDKMNLNEKNEVEVEKTLQLYGMIIYGNDIYDPDHPDNMGLYVEETNLNGITWTSNDTRIATVDNTGKVTGVSEGKVIIIAKYNDENEMYQINVKPKSNLNYKIGKVTGVKNKTQSTKTITLKWNKSTNASGYEVYKYDTKKKKDVKLGTTKNTTYKVTGLKAGTKYKFKVRAYKNINGKKYYGKYSSVKTLTTKTSTPKISKIKAKKEKVTVNWKRESRASGYEILYSTNKKFKSNNTKIEIKKNKTTSKTIKKLKSKKKYYFKIRTYIKLNGEKIYSSYSNVKKVKVIYKTKSSTSKSKSSYKSSCKNYNLKYEDIQRNPRKYKGLKMKFLGLVEQRWNKNGSLASFTLSASTEDNRYIGMIYCEIDKSVLNGGNLLQYDKIRVYGEFKGLTDKLYNYYYGGYADYPYLKVKYIEFVKE